MKFLELIQSIFVPRYMVIHRKMKVIFALIILIACSLIMSIPSSIYLNKMKYKELETQSGYDIFKYVDDNNTNPNNEFTIDELDKYNMVRFSDIKALKLVINNTDGIMNTDKSVVDAKEYVLKAIKPLYDEDGTYIKDEINYIHIVFDFSIEDNDTTYDIAENFNKIPNLEEARFGHYLLLFNDKALYFKMDATKFVLPNLSYYRKVEFNFNEMENAGEISDLISDTYVPALHFTYRMISLLFVGLFSLIISMLFSFILKDTGQLRGLKEYINFASIATIPFVIFAFAFSFITYAFCSLLFKWYAAFFGIYLFVLVIIVNRRPRIDDMNNNIN